MMPFPRLTIMLITSFLTACSQPPTNSVRVEKGWIAEIPSAIQVTAAWMTLHNENDNPVYLIAASSPNAGSIELHRSVVENGLAKMIGQEKLEIPASGSLAFNNTTGLHLMMYECKNVVVGRKIPITLEFKNGSSITSDFEVMDRRQRY